MDLFSSIQQRVPFFVFRKFIQLHGMPSGQGYTGIFTAIDSLTDQVLKARYVDLLLNMYTDHLNFGEKQLSLFRLEDDQHAALLGILPGLTPEEGAASTEFPFYLDEADLLASSSEPMLVSVEVDDDGYTLTYSSKRFFTERVDVELEELDKEFQDRYKDFEEILAIRKRYRQFFDVVRVPRARSEIEVRIDSPGHMRKKDVEIAEEKIEQVLQSLLGYALRGGVATLTSVNFFPLIDKLSQSSEGRICELGFITDGGGVKSSKMRRYEDDLRDEAYHKEGSKVAIITPYKIGVRWQLTRSAEVVSNPELFIAGSARQLNGANAPVVKTATIAKCIDANDFNFVYKIVDQYLNSVT